MSLAGKLQIKAGRKVRLVNAPRGFSLDAPITRAASADVILRPATPADLDLLCGWQKQRRVLAATDDDRGRERELDRRRDWREQLIAEAEGRPVGFIQTIDPAREESHYWRECPAGLRAIDIWIGEASDPGRGLGTRMMSLALERCFADTAVEAVLVDPLASNGRARRFYERLGFHFVERRQFGDDPCAAYRLERSTREECKGAA